jgi:DNA-directed RNA polymerase subunit beta'
LNNLSLSKLISQAKYVPGAHNCSKVFFATKMSSKISTIMAEFNALKIKIASPEEIFSWSYGEVLKAETINYRSQRPEKDGLFSERIFGPTKDYECYCGKYRRIRYKGIICDRCGVEVTHSSVRRERMGHIKLAAPVAHIWFLRTIPSKIGLFLNTPLQKLEKVIYYAAYIVTGVNEENRKKALEELGREFKSRKKIDLRFAEGSGKARGLEELKKARLQAKEDLLSLKSGKTLTETEYFNLARRFANVFEASSGAEAVRKILENIDLKKEALKIEKELETVKDTSRERYLLYRLKLIRSCIKNNSRPEWMILTVLPVLPPDLRPMVALDGGRYATSDLNDLYRRVINRNNRLKKLMELKAPEIIITNEKRMLQEAVDALFDNIVRFGTQPQLSSQRRPLRSLADMLKGKQGRFRQNLLGKRVDYSGRSVIVVGPELRLNECGIPKKMALELFKPFVINKIIERGMAHNIRNANHLIEVASPEIWAILEEVIAGKKVLLNRAPTLHRLGIQAFKPILIEDLCIRIPPMVCAAFNADFDGDQMAVHLPFTEEAQEEAVELMLSSGNILKPATGEPIVTPSQDIVLGCYFLTKIKEEDKEKKEKVFSSPEEAILAYNFGYLKINEPIKVHSAELRGTERGTTRKSPPRSASSPPQSAFIETSVGRLIFNGVLPKDFDFVNKTLNKKELQKLIIELIERYGLKEIWHILDDVKELGFYWATLSGISWGMNDLVIPPEKKKILKEAEEEIAVITKQYQDGLLTNFESRIKTIEVWERVISEVGRKVPLYLDRYGSVYSIIDSGARGSWSQPAQMAGMKGLVQSPKGETIELPIKASYKEGLSILEFFINTHGARKGLIDTALKTASAGYLTRRLVDVAQDLVIRENDCGTIEGIEISRLDGESFGYNFSQRLFSRTAAQDIKIGKKTIVKANEIIDHKAAEAIEKSRIESVKIRSPITCETLYGVCSKCYGLDLGRNEHIKLGEAVGIIAAQSIGEPGTQLTLRTFHAGGVAGVDITHGLPRVQELFEVRVPKGKAPLAEDDGVIEDIEEKGTLKIIKLKISKGNKKFKITEYPIPRTSIVFVKLKQEVKKGDQLCEGSIDLREFFELKGREAVERYVVNEIQKIYVLEGTNINDKHIEIIIKKMFSRVMIKDPGETDFIIGEIVEKSKFLEVNREAKKKNKQPAQAKQLLTGITKTALSTESFLSAASFQETARVLVMAAAEGRVDNLRGLKENVIIGRLIPAGTGFRKTANDH